MRKINQCKKNKINSIIDELYKLRNESYEKRKEKLDEWHDLMSEFNNINAMPEESYFDFVLETGPFDFWTNTISPNELFKKYKNSMEQYECSIAHKIKKEEWIIKKTIMAITGEEPIKIAFTSIPMPTGGPFELVGLAKIWSNGISFVFTCDLYYLEYLIKVRGL